MTLLLAILAFVRVSSQGIFGVNIHSTSPATGELAQLSTAFRINRMDFTWATIETQKGVYNFTAYDQLLQQQENQKIRSYWSMGYGNPLYDNGEAPYTDEGRNAFANFAVAAMGHFVGHNILWELWNEPNTPLWSPTPNATAYALLATTVGAKMDAAGFNGETYVGPAVLGFDTGFLSDIFTGGVLKYFDAVSVHPFRSGMPETVLSDYAGLTTAIKQANPGKPQSIISGAWGWTTCGPCTPESSLQIALPTQGKFLARQWLTNALGGVPVSIYYDWKDGPSSNDPQSCFGTVQNGSTAPYSPKPGFIAASAFQTYLAPTSYTFRVRIDTGDPNVYVLAYTQTGSSLTSAYAVWTTNSNTTCINVPTNQRTDCGYDGITGAQCGYRGCCYQSESTPACYFQQTGTSLSFNSSSSKVGVCFKVVDYLGNTINENLCQQNGQLTVAASDGPLYLVS